MLTLSDADRNRLNTILDKYKAGEGRSSRTHHSGPSNPVEDWVSLGEREFLSGIGQYKTSDGGTLYYTKIPDAPKPTHWWQKNVPWA